MCSKSTNLSNTRLTTTKKDMNEGSSRALQGMYREHPLCCAAFAAAACGYAMYRCTKLLQALRKRVMTQVMLNSLEHGIVHLFIHPRWPHGPNCFLHCFKVETFLRLAKISYIVHFIDDPTVSPNGKLPFILYDGVAVGDSEVIIHYLMNEFDVDLDNQLSAESHAVGRVVTRMVETSLNYGLQRVVLIDHPELLEGVLEEEFTRDEESTHKKVEGMRRTLVEVLETTGDYRLPPLEYTRQFLQEVKCLDVLLQKSAFLLGDTPTSYDAVVYAWLHVAKTLMEGHEELIPALAVSEPFASYVARMTSAAFPDMKSISGCNQSHRFTPHTCRQGCS